MLAEGILIRLIYKESCQQDKPQKSPASQKAKEGIWRQKLADIPKIKGFADGCEKWDEIPAGSSKAAPGSGPGWGSRKEEPGKEQEKQLQGSASPALHIPRRGQSPGQGDWYQSWPCIHENYPDLHIGGDRVGGHTCDSGCVLELPHSPILLSMDTPPGHSPPWEHPPQPGLPSLAAQEAGEEAGDRSILQEPLSNSALNTYMEAKVAELYKQVLEESLARCGSITNLLTCSWIRNNVEQLSFQISQEQKMEASRARGALLQSLALASSRHAPARNSSEFSTPSLHISSPVGGTRSCTRHFPS